MAAFFLFEELPLPTKRFQIFVSSTYNDLRDERERVLSELNREGHIAAGMEGFPATDDEQLEYIQRIIDESDYYVVIVKGRYGSLANDGLSFTEREFNYAVSKGIPALAFIFADRGSLPVRDTDDDPERLTKLRAFIERLESSRIVKYWRDSESLSRAVKDSINSIIRRKPGIGWVRGDQAMDATIITKLESLRAENEELKAKLNVDEASTEVTRCIQHLSDKPLQIDCEVTVYRNSDYVSAGRQVVRTATVTLSWVDTLLAISEFLYTEHHESYVYEEIRTLCKPHIELSNGEAVEFSEQSSRRIRAEFEALGLIDTLPQNFGLRWKATKLGRAVITQLRLAKPA